MFCPKCGTSIPEGSTVCPNCNDSMNETSTIVSEKSGSSFAWGILGFFIPLVGLILFLSWKKERPSDSKAAGIGALISVIASIVLYIIFFVFIFAATKSTISSGYYY